MEKMDTFLTNAGITSITKNDEKGNTAIHYAVGEPELLDKILMKATELGNNLNTLLLHILSSL